MATTAAGVIDQVVFGGLGMLAGVSMLVVTLRLRSNLGVHSRASIAMVLPERRVETAVLLLLACFGVMVVGLFAGAFGIVGNHVMLDAVSRVAVGVGIFGIIVYLWSLERATSKREFDDLVGGIVEYSSERANPGR